MALLTGLFIFFLSYYFLGIILAPLDNLITYLEIYEDGKFGVAGVVIGVLIGVWLFYSYWF